MPARGRLPLCLRLAPPLVLKLPFSRLLTTLFLAQPQRVSKFPLPTPCGDVGGPVR